ncbi:MAG: DNA mismatch repair protein MutS [Proteobacteria bacterium]|nr:DNA mismatch repair protein MutS [Pseudomonadota bacterium]
MAQDDGFVFEVAKKVILAGFEKDLATIRYRQDILQDCLNQPAIIREFYSLAVEAVEHAKRQYVSSLYRYPDWALRQSIEHMETFLGMFKRLRKLADSHAASFVSEGWTEFFTRLRLELNDEYFVNVEFHLKQLKFRNGVLLSAELGRGNKGSRYRLHRSPDQNGETWLMRLCAWLDSLFDPITPFFEQWTQLFERQPPACSFSVHPRDEGGARALGELRNQGISLAANALAQSTDHVRSFFSSLLTELVFYIGCMNLNDQLAGKGVPICFPSPVASDGYRLSFRGLYDVCLALNMTQRVVGNEVHADRKDLVIITGANQGGKSTLLRSIGLAQLMMQCGMFVPSDSYCSSICDALFTHFKREEDTALKSGKLDEELGRMSDIVDHITPYSMILLNESFAATNEREGSEIARQIISALVSERIKVICVTHLYELARGFYDGNKENFLFLRAGRQADGSRTFKLIEGEPLQTSFGKDLYNSVFAGGDLAA